MDEEGIKVMLSGLIPRSDVVCNKCSKKIETMWMIRLCDDCLDEFERSSDYRRDADGKLKLTDKEYTLLFAPKDPS